MQRLGGAVILMQQNLNDVIFLHTKHSDFEQIVKIKPLDIFSEIVIDFLNQLSGKLLADYRARKFPDVVTFAFWCRKSNILNLKKMYHDNQVRTGRGIVFHITPSNIPVNFAYSLVAGMLAGNINIVRVPSKDFEQTQIICEQFIELFQHDKFADLAEKLVLLKYERDSIATEYLSSLCDVRIIWGGDQAISQIRNCSIPARSFDITFADRYSLCVINADFYINEKKPREIANLFYNDTFLFDQNACSAPHLIIWLGEDKNIENSKNAFWGNLHSLVKEKYNLEAIAVVDKLTAMYRQVIEYDHIKIINTEDNYFVRINLECLQPNIYEYKAYSGYFCEFSTQDLNDIANIITRKYQTLSYYGLTYEQLKDFKLKNRLLGIDRMVPIGQTTDFSLTWDGYDLINSLSCICDIK